MIFRRGILLLVGAALFLSLIPAGGYAAKDSKGTKASVRNQQKQTVKKSNAKSDRAVKKAEQKAGKKTVRANKKDRQDKNRKNVKSATPRKQKADKAKEKARRVGRSAIGKTGITTQHEVSLMDLPTPVYRTLTREAGFSAIPYVEKIVNNGRLSYTAKIANGSRTREVVIAGNGKLTKQAVRKDRAERKQPRKTSKAGREASY